MHLMPEPIHCTGIMNGLLNSSYKCNFFYAIEIQCIKHAIHELISVLLSECIQSD